MTVRKRELSETASADTLTPPQNPGRAEYGPPRFFVRSIRQEPTAPGKERLGWRNETAES